MKEGILDFMYCNMKLFSIRLFCSFIICLLLVSSCQNGYSPERFMSWCESNADFHKRVIQESYVFDVSYIPLELMILREYGSEFSQEEFDFKKEQFDSLQYFSMKIGAANGQVNALKNNIGSSEEYYSKIEYFVSGAQKEFYLQNGDEYVKCRLYHFERYYNSVPYDVLVLGFPKFCNNTNEENIVLKYFDQILGVGQVTFDFESNQIYNIPKINL